ncbi:DUF1624 domain-containing protein [Egibacter rhizosphaerae]|uniref:DUF1624 domain-containing protein n=1 Tax=Egibacter rhizosphaerae TaxID=1670831 RepID=A0A411YHI2_9ACTN|nr:heparan-alpha-glucosaminide N-acetyltransferase domain-containing protein [Egibacter rhizosphaerae]QBI20700.1 DUF1624 domain-containing protein [Egibacter rhizosphaerae]
MASATPAVAAPAGLRGRLGSLDAFRGFTVASMIFVSSLGGGSANAPYQLTHVQWHGATFRDLIAPFFLFAMGMAMAFALARYVEGRTEESPWPGVVRRGALLVLIGFALNFALYELPETDLSTFRIMGVLQRIGLAYLAAATIVLLVRSVGAQVAIGLVILVGYGIALATVPVPGAGAGVLTPEGNLAGYVDRLVLTEAHLHRGGPFDPEGLLSTIPSVVTVMLGWWTGRWLRSHESRSTAPDAVSSGSSARPGRAGVLGLLVAAGLLGVGGGLALGELQPVNKAMWTPAFVLLTAGWGWLILAGFYGLVELVGMRRLGWTFEVFGRNALFAFTVPRVIAHLLDLWEVGPEGEGAFTYAYEGTIEVWAEPLFGVATASVLYGLLVTVVWWGIHYGMYRRGWFVRL